MPGLVDLIMEIYYDTIREHPSDLNAGFRKKLEERIDPQAYVQPKPGDPALRNLASALQKWCPEAVEAIKTKYDADLHALEVFLGILGRGP